VIQQREDLQRKIGKNGKSHKDKKCCPPRKQSKLNSYEMYPLETYYYGNEHGQPCIAQYLP